MAEPTIQLGGGNWAGKTDNLLGYYKEGERFYKQEFTFSRSTTGTYTDSDGYIQEMPYNLLTYSEDFSEWVTQSGGTGSAPIITSNSAISPDGTQNADKIVFNKGTGVSTSDLSVIASSSFTTQTNTASFYIKADSPQKIVFRNSTNWQLVDVTTEWQRIDKTDTGNGVQVGLRDGYGISGVPNTATIYLWGFQAVKGTSAKTYFPTTTRLNMPRVDYLNNSNGSLILEPQRTNLITYSEDFSQSYWTKQNSSIVSNNAISPDGSLNADKIIATATNSSHSAFVSLSSSTSSGTSYCYSFFAKAKEYTKTAIRIGGSGYSTQPMAVINLLNGSVVSQQGFISLSIKDFSNGWYKINAVFTATSSVAPNIQPIADGFTTTSDNYTYNGDGTSGIYIWGAMFEQGSYPTSIINTSGSSVTRNADACELTNVADRIGQTEGTMFLDFVLDSVDGTLDFRFQLYGNNSVNNWVFVGMTNGDIRAYVNDTTNQFDSSFSGVVGTRYKLALAYKENDFAFYANGIQKSVSTSGTIPSLDSVSLGDSVTSANMVVKESVNQAQIYNTRLSNSELATLTTI
jgi:hypothetical protein